MSLEFPESSVIAAQMRQVLPLRRVEKVNLRDPNSSVFRWGFVNLHQVDLTGQVIQGIRQFGDYIYLDFGPHTLFFGDMIGKILYHPAGQPRPPRAAVLFELDDGAAFSYNPSLYGYCKALTADELARIQPDTWVQPLDDAFTADYLAQAFAEPERKIAKQMNIFNVKYKVAGVGIGYWQEVLFACGIHPQRPARQISPGEIRQLQRETVRVMRAALEQDGSVDEVDFFGQSGRYTREMSGKMKGKPCPVCGAVILGKNILGANVYFCPACQK